VTGYATRNDQERALAAGFDSFLVKPLEPQTLTRLLRAAVSRVA
jgi:CheY-like chemotaxis protein